MGEGARQGGDMGSFAKLAKRAVETEAPVTVKIQELLRGTNGVMSLAQGVVYGQPPEAALNKVKEIVREPSISKYGSDDGLPELREALLEKAVNMSVNTLKDLNVPQSAELEKTKDNSVKSCITKPVLNSNRCVNKEENAPPACPDAATNAMTNGCESGNTDVEYIDSENLTDLPDVDASLSTLVARLDSKDWVMTCEALNNVRQLAIYHKERLQELLEPLFYFIVKSVKNPRSAVCKTALMTCADIFKAYMAT